MTGDENNKLQEARPNEKKRFKTKDLQMIHCVGETVSLLLNSH